MVRIKGANSDYLYTGDLKEPIKEDKNAYPLYLKIFICPNDMPSRVEKPHDGKWCEGTDAECPSQEKEGHALICLDEKEGISLVANKGISLFTNNKIKAKGTFVLEANSGKEVLMASENSLSFVGKDIDLKISEQEVSMQLGGAKISITQSGDIELSTPNQRQITIKGNLTVQGNLKVTGNLDLSEATKKSLTEEIRKSL